MAVPGGLGHHGGDDRIGLTQSRQRAFFPQPGGTAFATQSLQRAPEPFVAPEALAGVVLAVLVCKLAILATSRHLCRLLLVLEFVVVVVAVALPVAAVAAVVAAVESAVAAALVRPCWKWPTTTTMTTTKATRPRSMPSTTTPTWPRSTSATTMPRKLPWTISLGLCQPAPPRRTHSVGAFCWRARRRRRRQCASIGSGLQRLPRGGTPPGRASATRSLQAGNPNTGARSPTRSKVRPHALGSRAAARAPAPPAGR